MSMISKPSDGLTFGERLYYAGSLTTHNLRPRVERRAMWPYGVVAAAFLAAAAMWAPVVKAQHQHAAPIGLSGKVQGGDGRSWAGIIGVPAGTLDLDSVPLSERYRALTSTDPLEPVAAAAGNVTRRAPSTFILSSDGGDAIPALIAAKYMRLGGHTAVVRAGQECWSACVLVLLSAETVVVELGAGVWLHGLSHGDGNPANRAELVGMLARHLRAVLPPGPASEALIAVWLAMPPTAYRRLTEREMRAIGIRVVDSAML